MDVLNDLLFILMLMYVNCSLKKKKKLTEKQANFCSQNKIINCKGCIKLTARLRSLKITLEEI